MTTMTSRALQLPTLSPTTAQDSCHVMTTNHITMMTPSLTNARWGSLYVHFTLDGCYVTTTTPSCLQMRGRALFHSRRLPRPPLACKCEVGAVLASFHLGRPPRHDEHPLSLANARWGSFYVRFTQDSCFITRATPSHLLT